MLASPETDLVDLGILICLTIPMAYAGGAGLHGFTRVRESANENYRLNPRQGPRQIEELVGDSPELCVVPGL
jgi:hypothetical protein